MNILKKIVMLATIVAVTGVSVIIPNVNAEHNYDSDLVKFAPNPSVYLVNFKDGGYYLDNIANEAVFNYYGFDFADVDEYISPSMGDFPIATDVLGFRDFTINLKDNTLFKFSGDSNIYLYSNDFIYLIPSEEIFNSQGFSFEDVLETTNYTFENRDEFEIEKSTYSTIHKTEISDIIDFEMTTNDILDISSTNFSFVQAEGDSAVYRVEGKNLYPLPNGDTAYLLYGNIWDDGSITVVSPNSLGAFNMQETIAPLSGMIYSADFSNNIETYSTIGFYSDIEENNLTHPDWYNGSSPYVQGNDMISDVYNSEYQNLVLTNPSSTNETNEHYADPTSDIYFASSTEEYLFDEAVGLDLSNAEFSMNSYLEDGDTLYVQYDIFYTGNEEIELALGHEVFYRTDKTYTEELETITISQESGWIKIGMEIEYNNSPDIQSQGLMLYFGNVDSNEELYLGYTALYK